MQALLTHPLILTTGMFVAFWLCLEFGRWVAHRDPEVVDRGAAIKGAIFSILGLLIAFTFSGAATRFDHRRDLIVTEATAIDTAYLRIDVAPVDAQPALRDAFRRYTASRLAAYRVIADPAAFRAALDRSATVQREIWRLAVAAGRRPDAQPATNLLLLPALNAMIDITTTRAAATLMHPPTAIYEMLLGLALVSAVLAGLGVRSRRDWLHMVSFAVVITATFYIILDIEYPRLGAINLKGFEAAVIHQSRDP